MRPAGQSQDAVSCALQAPGADDGADAAPSPCEVEMSACKLREAFSQFDTSGDGYLDKAELVKILTRGRYSRSDLFRVILEVGDGIAPASTGALPSTASGQSVHY